MICIINPETRERLLLSEAAYGELLKKHNAWRRALENAVDVPDELGADAQLVRRFRVGQQAQG